MSVDIDGYAFEGPYTDINKLENRSGIYAVLDHQKNGIVVVDIGESAEVKSRIENHDRRPCWSENSNGTLEVAVLYTTSLHQCGRKEIEQKIRNKFHPSCGDR